MVQTYLIVIIHFFHFIVDLHDICAAWITEKMCQQEIQLEILRLQFVHHHEVYEQTSPETHT